MSHLNGTGPDEQGTGTGRKLGLCSAIPDDEKLIKLGRGQGKRRNSGGGIGKGNRLKHYAKK